MKFLKLFIVCLALFLLAGALYLRFIRAPQADKNLNLVRPHTAYQISEHAKALHGTLAIADLHSDTLLWARNPTKRHAHGHADLPRLRESGVRVQVFSAVTQSPKGLNFENNRADSPDDITLLALAQLWPPRTWGSLYERAVFQARRLQKLEADSHNNLRIARTRNDMTQLSRDPDLLLGVMATEGSHPLEGKLENVKRLYDEGYRMMGLHHFFDNELGGSMHGVSKGGLTEFGRRAIAEMDRLNIIIDVAHSSEASVRETLALTSRPIVLSHGGVRSACPRTAHRNLPDDVLAEIAQRGGLIGIAYFDGAICDISPDGIAQTIIAAIDLMGEDAVALGSDFDGSVSTALDSSELAAITHALLEKGVSPEIIRKVMGGNVIHFLTDTLPEN